MPPYAWPQRGQMYVAKVAVGALFGSVGARFSVLLVVASTAKAIPEAR